MVVVEQNVESALVVVRNIADILQPLLAFDSLDARMRHRDGGIMFHASSSRFPNHMLEGLVHQIVEHTSAVIFVKDVAFRYLLVNRQFEELFDLSWKTIIGLTDYDIFPHEVADGFRRNDDFVMDTGESIKCEEVAPHDDGPHTYLSVKFPLRDDAGRVFAVAGISTDITEWRQTQREMESLHLRYETILESVGDGVCGLDIEGRITFLNPAGGRLLGYSADELKGKCRKQFVVERRKSTQPGPVETVLSGGESRQVTDAVFRRKDGTHMPVEYVASPRRDGDRTIGAVIAFRDVSDRIERLRTEHELLAARAVQQALYPKSDPRLKGFEICGVTHPASLTSGDYYDYIPTPDGGLVIVVGDVSGHGLGPALEMVETRASFRTILHYETDIGEALRRLNQVLAHDLPEGMFVTLFAVRLDSERRSMVYTSAGHQANILFQSNDISRLDSTGTVLGIFEETPFPTSVEIPLHSGDLIVLATDGIMEQSSSPNEEGDTELYGWDRTMSYVRQHRHRPADEILERLCQDVRRFAKGAPQNDDVTAVVIKVC